MKNLKNKSFFIFCSLLLLSLTGNAQVTKKATTLPNQTLDSKKAIYLNTIDPAVTSIEFKTIKRNTGDILRITGKVKNIGGKNYTSNANQQLIQLWEINSTADKKMVKTLPFTNLNSNQEISIVHERPAFKNSNEFPPDYEVIITYDPDIFIDNNKNNDDANAKNNSLRKNPKS